MGIISDFRGTCVSELSWCVSLQGLVLLIKNCGAFPRVFLSSDLSHLFSSLGLLHWALRAAVFSKLLIIIPWGICGAPAPPEGPRTGQRLGGAPGVPSARPWHSAGALGLLAHLGTPGLVTSCGLVQPLLPGFWHSLGWWWPRVGPCPGDVLFQMFWHWGQAEISLDPPSSPAPGGASLTSVPWVSRVKTLQFGPFRLGHFEQHLQVAAPLWWVLFHHFAPAQRWPTNDFLEAGLPTLYSVIMTCETFPAGKGGKCPMSSAPLPQLDPIPIPSPWNCVSYCCSRMPVSSPWVILLPVPVFQSGYPKDKALIPFSSSFVTVSPWSNKDEDSP